MAARIWLWVRRGLFMLLILVLAGVYWLLPIQGGVLVIPGEAPDAPHWPVVRLSPTSPKPGQVVNLWVTDVEAFPHVKLVVAGESHEPVAWPRAADDTLIWKWRFTVPEHGARRAVLYHDCHKGCVVWKRIDFRRDYASPDIDTVPTKLGVVFANPDRDWHGRSGWVVDLTYARLAGQAYWGLEDLVGRVHQATVKGLRVLVRVDYDQGQSIPPAGAEE